MTAQHSLLIKMIISLLINIFHDSIKNLLDKYLPLKKLSKKYHKRKYKPWITNGILTSIKRKDKLFGKYIRTKDPLNKHVLHDEYKALRNRIIELINTSKQNFYHDYFEKNSNNIRNIWKGINQIVNVKSKSYDSLTCLTDKNDQLITDPSEISNSFNNYSSTIGD